MLHRWRGLSTRQAESSEREAIQNIIERVAQQIADANHSQDEFDGARGVVAVRRDESGARGGIGLHVRLRPVLGVQQRGEFTFRRVVENTVQNLLNLRAANAGRERDLRVKVRAVPARVHGGDRHHQAFAERGGDGAAYQRAGARRVRKYVREVLQKVDWIVVEVFGEGGHGSYLDAIGQTPSNRIRRLLFRKPAERV